MLWSNKNIENRKSDVIHFTDVTEWIFDDQLKKTLYLRTAEITITLSVKA